MKKRNKRGQYKSSLQSHLPLVFLLVTMVIGLFIQLAYQPKPEMAYPIPRAEILEVGRVYAKESAEKPEIVIEPSTTPMPSIQPEKTEKEQIIAYIHHIFGDDGELMVKIFTCESGLNPKAVGDTRIMGNLDGEMIGDSVGIGQIRTGNKAGAYDKASWNRAKANGMSVEEFRTKLKDWKYNVDYAKTIFDRQGVHAWHKCYMKAKSI